MYCVQPLPLWQKAAAGLTAGGLGALVGSPADLSLIRMQSDSTLPVAQRRNYKGVGDALLRIIKDEGMGGLFRGAGPTVVRAMSLNMGMLASNDEVKKLLAALHVASKLLLDPRHLLSPVLYVRNIFEKAIILVKAHMRAASELYRSSQKAMTQI